jgi:hypothetical protein
VTVAECIAVGGLHAAGLPLPSSSSLRRCRPSQIMGLFMCVPSEGLDTTGIDNTSSSRVNSRCGGGAMTWKRQSGKHLRFWLTNTTKCSHARLLLLLGITHLELDRGSQRGSKAMGNVEEHAQL